MAHGAYGATRRNLERALIATFLVGISAPLCAFAVSPKNRRTALLERRLPAPKPRLELSRPSIASFPERFEAYFGDRFWPRATLLKGASALKWYGLGISPTPILVRGKDDWSFFADERSMDIYRGVLPFTQGELESWRRLLEDRRDWLASRGIRYVFVVAPNKEQIYPEFLPNSMNQVGPTRLDQLVDYLRARSDFELLDLRAALRAEKARDRPDHGDFCYFPLGTHWQDRGAHAGYVAMIQRLDGSDLDPVVVERSELEQVLSRGQGDSWAQHLYLEQKILQKKYDLRFRAPANAQRLPFAGQDRDVVLMGRSSSALPTAIVLHDSFGTALIPFLAESFARVAFRRTYDFDREWIEAERPSVVIQEVIERALLTVSPFVPGTTAGASADQEELRARFEGSSDVLLELDVLHNLPPMEPFGGAEVRAGRDNDSGVMLAQISCPADLIALPEFALPADSTAVIALELYSPEETRLDAIYSGRNGPAYDSEHSLRLAVHKGRNRLYLAFDPPVPEARMLLRPGLKPRRYRVHSLEIRAVGR